MKTWPRGGQGPILRNTMCFVAATGLAATSFLAGFDTAHSQQVSKPGDTLLHPPQDTTRKLTRDELKGCMKRAVDINATETKANGVAASLAQERQKLEARQNDIKQASQNLNRYSQNDVDAFNAKVNEFNVAQQAFNASVDNFNKIRDQNQVVIHAYNTDCAGFYFGKDVEFSVLAELGLKDNPMGLVPSK